MGGREEEEEEEEVEEEEDDDTDDNDSASGGGEEEGVADTVSFILFCAASASALLTASVMSCTSTSLAISWFFSTSCGNLLGGISCSAVRSAKDGSFVPGPGRRNSCNN